MVRTESAWERLKIERRAERFRDSTGGGAGFVSPAGRVRGRRRAAPSAFVVAATGRPSVEIWGDEAESGLGTLRRLRFVWIKGRAIM